MVSIAGLEEVKLECESLNIEFHLLIGNGEEVLPEFVEENKIGAVVIDFMPLRECLEWSEKLKKTLATDIPLCQVSVRSRVRYLNKFPISIIRLIPMV